MLDHFSSLVIIFVGLVFFNLIATAAKYAGASPESVDSVEKIITIGEIATTGVLVLGVFIEAVVSLIPRKKGTSQQGKLSKLEKRGPS